MVLASTTLNPRNGKAIFFHLFLFLVSLESVSPIFF